MIPAQRAKAAKEFAERWKGKGYEKGESQIFWSTLLTEVFGVEHVDSFLLYEQQVHLDHTSFIDGFIPSTKVMIEQKSLNKDLGAPIKQSDGTSLNPFQQAKRYAAELPYSQRPRWIVTCNFREFWVYDMEQPNGEPQKILLENLEKEYYRLQFLVDEGNEHIKQEQKVSEEAGKLVGLIYDALLAQYHEPENPETLRSLNILCVRLVFCLYAEDAGLFSSRTAFHDYLAQYPSKDIRRALKDLFETLDTPEDKRDPYLEDVLKAFPYVNGGLFSNDTRLEIPQFTDELKELILSKASDDFDWSEISPTIFGAIFESTLNPETRRSGGMHYTSIANIHKVIDPLFLDDLKAEFDTIKAITNDKQQRQRLDAFQDKLAALTFFDPACGSGNFLTESYVSLRRLENQLILLRNKGQGTFGDIADPIKVDIHQFYGIEINDFAVSVATTALWIAEQQMLQETQKIVSFNVNPLPLKAYHNILEGNALRLDWSEVIAPDCLNYIMGNPPFVGKKEQSKEQKEEVFSIFGKKWKGIGNIDYVSCWYMKAVEMMQQNPSIHAAFVSTNSITQGEQVATLWKPLFEQYSIHFDFAYRTFRWDSEADIKAHVHCVIIGFSVADNSAPKRLYLPDGTYTQCANINGYLLDAPNAFIESRTKPLCDVPSMSYGSMPIDNGFLILEKEDVDSLLQENEQNAKFIRPYVGGLELIQNKERWCLWLQGISPKELRASAFVMNRIEQTRQFRLSSDRPQTIKAADTPYLFGEIRQPDTDMLAIPKVSSEKRRYIPIAFVNPNTIVNGSALIVPDATLYAFGVLISNIHNAWMRVVCGRMKSDYQYSANIVYNNFPWPTPTEEQMARIEQTAQAILDARAKYPDCSLADLYDEVTMPPELRRAHQENDRAVMAAYGFTPGQTTESECVAKLFELYKELTK
jgi:type I restriction-modification system DNA methylase subunit